jgi:uncharacterized protein YifN (PemK superfamily)
MPDEMARRISQRVEKLLIDRVVDPDRLEDLLDFEDEFSASKRLHRQHRPQAGNVLWCRLSPGIGDEMYKRRPVIVLSPLGQNRSKLFIVVPLSSTPPDVLQPFNLHFPIGTIRGLSGRERWLKADAISQVSRQRLDRVDGDIPSISAEMLKQVQKCVLEAIGLGALTNHL